MIFLVSLLAISSVSATDNITDDTESIDEQSITSIEPSEDISSIESEKINDSYNEDVLKEDLNDENILSSEVDEDILGASPPYNKYSVSISDYTMNYGTSKTVTMYITPATGYSYAYDFYFRVYDSNGNKKIDENLYSSTSTTSKTYTIGGTTLSPGKYTIKLENYADQHIMDTATLTVQSLPSSAYSVSVSDTTINYGSSGSIYMAISPASSSYYYRYDYYLKVYDSNNVEKISHRYYSTSSSYSQTYSLSSTQLEPGTYTIKLLDTNHQYQCS